MNPFLPERKGRGRARTRLYVLSPNRRGSAVGGHPFSLSPTLVRAPHAARTGEPPALIREVPADRYDSGNLIVQPIDLVTVGSISSPLAIAFMAVMM